MASYSAKRKFKDIDTVTFLVGASKSAFHVHQDVVCDASPVFNAAFNSRFKEGTERTMELPEEDANIFEHFVTWLYCKGTDWEISISKAPDVYQLRLTHISQIYVFASRYDVKALQSSICQLFFVLARDTTVYSKMLLPLPSFDVLEYVYANTNRNDIIRKIIADWFAWSPKSGWQGKGESTDWIYDVPEFGTDLALALYDKAVHTSVRNPFIKARPEFMEIFCKGSENT